LKIGVGTFLKAALFSPAAYGLVTIVGLLVLLEATVQANLVSKWIVPLPTEVGSAIWELFVSDTIESALASTTTAVAVCTALVIAFGLPIGYLLYRYPKYGEAYGTLLKSLFSVPMILLFPVFLVMFGRNYVAIICCAFSHCVLPVIIYTHEALFGVPAVLLKVGKTFRVSNRDKFWKIMLPHALPTIFVGIRLAMIYVLVYIVGIEYMISFGGLGHLISDMYARFDIPKTFAAIVFVILLSGSLYFVMRGIEAWMRRLR